MIKCYLVPAITVLIENTLGAPLPAGPALPRAALQCEEAWGEYF